MPNNSTNGIQPYRETAGILGFEILYKRVTSAQTSKCPWFNVCSLGQNTEIEEKSSEINQISYECVCNQWDKKGKCFMTQILKFYRLDKKKFIQSQFSTIQNIM
jgi:hypothetical protein